MSAVATPGVDRPAPGARGRVRQVPGDQGPQPLPAGTLGRVVRTDGARLLCAFPPDDRYWLRLVDVDWWQAPVDRNLKMKPARVDANRG